MRRSSDILVVAGARPNFVKVAPLLREMERRAGLTPLLVHTGQHYDAEMSACFFEELGVPTPIVNLGVGAASHARQTAAVLHAIEPVLVERRPDRVLVVGDVNSTVAAALAAAKLGIPVDHVEAGLRSFDRSMPEEINRIVTDVISDLLFVSEPSGRENLLREGVGPERIHLVGNVMIDTLRFCEPRWRSSQIWARLGLPRGHAYGMLTLHRPSNVDDPRVLGALLRGVAHVAKHMPMILPVHPRARTALSTRPDLMWRDAAETRPCAKEGIVCIPPLGYLDCVALMSGARLVLTDSGGVQEETTALGVPCLTLRANTERPVTVTHGTNRVIGIDPGCIERETTAALERPREASDVPPLWDGHAARRIVDILASQTAMDAGRASGWLTPGVGPT
jgi:UDP-N-acetylglucosamine 2-epimerase (non-hydrolysing)